MADLKISQLSDGGASQAADEYVIARSGSNYRIDGASVAAAATSVGTLTSLTVSGDVTVDTSTLKVDSANNRVGIGTASPQVAFTVSNNGSAAHAVRLYDTGANASYLALTASNTDTALIASGTSAVPMDFYTGGSVRMRLDTSGNLGLGVTPSAWTTASGRKAIEIGSLGNAMFGNGASDFYMLSNAYRTASNFIYANNGPAAAYRHADAAHQWFSAASGTAGNTISFTQAMTLDASGNLLVGAATGASTTTPIRISSGGTYGTTIANGYKIALFDDGSTRHGLGVISGNLYMGTADPSTVISFATNNTERARIDASGNLGLGTTSPAGAFEIVRNSSSGSGTAYPSIRLDNQNASGYTGLYFLNSGTNKAFFELKNDVGALTMGTGTTERARITSGGILGVGVTNPTGSTGDAEGIQITPTYILANRSAGAGLGVNRKTNDGDLVIFYQADDLEGSISVSGNTVSYNAFAGSHWSQLEDGSKPEILRGTVMEALNELCEWPGEQNERLPKAKVSDTAGSKKVYGVFMTWDNDWTETNDMLVTSLGAFICRIAADVVVEQGDLLESNGDGTARVQADDVIRSSTIGKVTSTVKTHEYEDGTYCVPTVLYCG